MSKQMYFHNTDFQPGKNITVRLGDKWSSLSPGDVVEVVDVETESICRKINVLNVETMMYKDLPEDILHLEHNVCCKTKEGLTSELSKIYQTFNPETDLVSIIAFSS